MFWVLTRRLIETHNICFKLVEKQDNIFITPSYLAKLPLTNLKVLQQHAFSNSFEPSAPISKHFIYNMQSPAYV